MEPNDRYDEVSAQSLATALRGMLPNTPSAAFSGGVRSAVMILLYDRDNDAHLILTKRSDEVSHHPGQISLPGGRYEDTDMDLLATALRETHEELGIDPARVQPLGALDEVRTSGSGFVVTPFVGFLAGPPDAKPHVGEVARILEVPIREILTHDARLPTAAGVETLRYPVLGEDVWGATARIMRDFCTRVRESLTR